MNNRRGWWMLVVASALSTRCAIAQWNIALVNSISPTPGGLSFGVPGRAGSGIAYTYGPSLRLGSTVLIPQGSSYPGMGGGAIASMNPLISTDGQNIVFGTTSSTGASGLFNLSGGNTSVIAETAVPAPGVGTFTSFGAASRQGNGVAFRATLSDRSGIYAWNNGVVSTLADTTMQTPGGVGNFTGFRDPILRAGRATFLASPGGTTGGGTVHLGIYERSLVPGSSVVPLVDRNTQAPDGSNFAYFYQFGHSEDLTAFTAHTFATGVNSLANVYLRQGEQTQLIATPAFLFNLVPGPQTDRQLFYEGISVGGDTVAISLRMTYFGMTHSNHLVAYRNGEWSVVRSYLAPPSGSHSSQGAWAVGPDSTTSGFISHSVFGTIDNLNSQYYTRVETATQVPSPGLAVLLAPLALSAARRRR